MAGAGKLCMCFNNKSRFVRILTILIVANVIAGVTFLCTFIQQHAAAQNISNSKVSLKLHRHKSHSVEGVNKDTNKLHKTLHVSGDHGAANHHFVNTHTSQGKSSIRHRQKVHKSTHRHHYNHHWKLKYHPRNRHHYPLYVEDWKDSVMKIGDEYHVKNNKDLDYTKLRRNTSSDVMFDDVAAENPHVMLGGRFKPQGIRARSKVAIIIPYRNRWFHLRMLLHHLHPILQKQGLEYGIFIVHQRGKEIFNKASLLNVGYLETSKADDYKCFIFHDVDLIPENHRCLYTCSDNTNDPRHISIAISKYGYRSTPDVTIGGISAFNRRQFEAVNGWSNQFHGWGGEDDDMAKRIRFKHMKIRRPSHRICRFTSLPHERDKGNPHNKNRWRLLRTSQQRVSSDGLNTIKYNVVATTKFATYTNISVELL